jgi:hypothetical protein
VTAKGRKRSTRGPGDGRQVKTKVRTIFMAAFEVIGLTERFSNWLAGLTEEDVVRLAATQRGASTSAPDERTREDVRVLTTFAEIEHCTVADR